MQATRPSTATASKARHAEEDVAKGEHGGRRLEQDGYAVELAIAEDGTPPKYRAWLYQRRKALPTGSVDGAAHASWQRSRKTTCSSARPTESLMATSIVGEPHSFDVDVLANIDGKALRWAYPSYEGRTDHRREGRAGVRHPRCACRPPA